LEVKYFRDVTDLPQLSVEESLRLKEVTKKFPFYANSYYLDLINWQDEADPIRRMVVPTTEELEDELWGATDPSRENHYTTLPGLQHKYSDTAIMLAGDSCYGNCRYCFRKRLFVDGGRYEVLRDYKPAISYIEGHKEISNVILTGGDPLLLETSRLSDILTELKWIKHVKIIRIGTKAPVYNPFRIIDDAVLPRLIDKISGPQKLIYFMLHFSHPREITSEAVKAVGILLRSGAVLLNHHPLIRGVNDSPEVLAELHSKLSFIGVSPYYVYQVRPAKGNKTYSMPIARAYRIFQESQKQLSGIAKRARFVLSHKLGKIEVIGLDENYIYTKYHRSPKNDLVDRMVTMRIDEEKYWL